MKTSRSLHEKSYFLKDLNSNSIHRKKIMNSQVLWKFIKNLAVYDQKLKYWIYWMQIPASAKSFASKYCYQLDSLKLSRDQKQDFNPDKGNITLK